MNFPLFNGITFHSSNVLRAWAQSSLMGKSSSSQPPTIWESIWWTIPRLVSQRYLSLDEKTRPGQYFQMQPQAARCFIPELKSFCNKLTLCFSNCCLLQCVNCHVHVHQHIAVAHHLKKLRFFTKVDLNLPFAISYMCASLSISQEPLIDPLFNSFC